MSWNESSFGLRWVKSASSKGSLCTRCYYERLGPNAWRQYEYTGETFGIKSDMDVLVYLSNGAKFCKPPKFSEKNNDKNQCGHRAV